LATQVIKHYQCYLRCDVVAGQQNNDDADALVIIAKNRKREKAKRGPITNRAAPRERETAQDGR